MALLMELLLVYLCTCVHVYLCTMLYHTRCTGAFRRSARGTVSVGLMEAGVHQISFCQSNNTFCLKFSFNGNQMFLYLSPHSHLLFTFSLYIFNKRATACLLINTFVCRPTCLLRHLSPDRKTQSICEIDSHIPTTTFIFKDFLRRKNCSPFYWKKAPLVELKIPPQ